MYLLLSLSPSQQGEKTLQVLPLAYLSRAQILIHSPLYTSFYFCNALPKNLQHPPSPTDTYKALQVALYTLSPTFAMQ